MKTSLRNLGEYDVGFFLRHLRSMNHCVQPIFSSIRNIDLRILELLTTTCILYTIYILKKIIKFQKSKKDSLICISLKLKKKNYKIFCYNILLNSLTCKIKCWSHCRGRGNYYFSNLQSKSPLSLEWLTGVRSFFGAPLFLYIFLGGETPSSVFIRITTTIIVNSCYSTHYIFNSYTRFASPNLS